MINKVQGFCIETQCYQGERSDWIRRESKEKRERERKKPRL